MRLANYLQLRVVRADGRADERFSFTEVAHVLGVQTTDNYGNRADLRNFRRSLKSSGVKEEEIYEDPYEQTVVFSDAGRGLSDPTEAIKVEINRAVHSINLAIYILTLISVRVLFV